MMTELIKDDICKHYKTRLPVNYLNSDELYLTQAAYDMLLSLDDDRLLYDAMQEGQFSKGFVNFIQIEYEKTLTLPDRTTSMSIEILQDAIFNRLNDFLDLDDVVIQ